MEYCGGPLWDWQLAWYTDNPDITRCFQDSILLLVPCAVLWLLAPFELWLGSRSPFRQPWTAQCVTKLVLCCILMFIQICYLWDSTHIPGGYYPVQFWSPLIQLVTLVFAICMVLYNRNQGSHTSAALFAFWLLYTVGNAVKYRSVLIGVFSTSFAYDVQPGDGLRFTLTVVSFPIILCQLVLSCFSDKKVSYDTPDKKLQSPEKEASFLSVLLFWWFNSLAALGYKRALGMGDMYKLEENNTTQGVVKLFKPQYDDEIKKKQHVPTKAVGEDGSEIFENQTNILYPLLRTFGWNMLGIAFIKLVASLLTFVAPQVLNALITFVSSDEPIWKGAFLASIMLLSSMFESLMNSQYEYRISRLAMRVRSVVIHSIYCKALKLSGSAKGMYTTGEIVNLMSVDTQRLMDQINMVNMLWSIPLQIGISIYFLWQQLGIATLGGVTVMILLMPLNAIFTVFLRKLQIRLMRDKDRRTKLMNEILSGIRVLKLYAWEKSFMKRVEGIRNSELGALRSQAYLSGFMTFSFTAAPFLVALSSFATYVLSDPTHVLDANKAFVSLSLFNIMKMPMAFLPMLITFTAMFYVSLKRINTYLRSEELDADAVQRITGGEYAISVKDGTFAYSEKSPKPVLEDINMQVTKGQLVAVVGTVGAGKSTLLGALLGDVNKIAGTVTVSGSVAYVPQQAWIQGASIRNNILFGNRYDSVKYARILDVCELRPDLEILPGGDETEVGEKGINLSGGQKQRVSLARAVYSGSDIFLFDDPLSAVDSHVSKNIFDKVISNKGITTGKTRVLVTHRLSVLPECDVVYVIKDGRISESGTYKQLVSRKGAFADFLIQFLQGAEGGDTEIAKEDLQVMEEIVKDSEAHPMLIRQLSRLSGAESETSESGTLRRRRARTGSNASSVKSAKSKGSKVELSKADKKATPGAKLTDEEIAAVGSVKWTVYWQYLVAMGFWGSLITVFSFILSNVFNIVTSIWLSDWSEDPPELASTAAQRDYRLGFYALWGILETAASLVASISLNLIALRGGKVLHERMLFRVLRAPMSFFDTTPMGRVLNRFAKDIDTADVTMRFNLRMLTMQLFRTLASIILISIETPLFLVLVLPLAVIYYFVQKYYIATSRQLKRLESISRSPVYVHFSETLTGSTSIRAYGAQERFIKLSNNFADTNHSAYYPSLGASRWLSVRLEFLGYMIVFVAAMLAATSRETLSPGLAGLTVTYALTITGTLNMLVKATSDIETNFVSIERCIEYSVIDVEDEWVKENNRPSREWPDKGEIEFHDYSTRYRPELPLVVKSISAKLHPGEKVGVVGRTGAGKSSLTLSLFRLIEAAEGYISVDSIDISRIGLHDLRSKLTIIPQDPVLFSGSLRSNLDPFETFRDEQVWGALEQAHLKDFVTGLETGLEHVVTEGGENISVGQRQLVCLARALLRKSRILILDEATAAVDLETDALIQETLRKEFNDSTTLTIAHRLNTIMDYDRVMVLSEGRVMEYDSPQTLLKDESSMFYSMAKDAGLV